MTKSPPLVDSVSSSSLSTGTIDLRCPSTSIAFSGTGEQGTIDLSSSGSQSTVDLVSKSGSTIDLVSPGDSTIDLVSSGSSMEDLLRATLQDDTITLSEGGSPTKAESTFYIFKYLPPPKPFSIGTRSCVNVNEQRRSARRSNLSLAQPITHSGTSKWRSSRYLARPSQPRRSGQSTVPSREEMPRQCGL